MKNKLIHGGFHLLKTDEDKKPLAGVKFGLYQSDGTLLKEFTTNNDGRYSMNDLLYGEYFIKEVETVDGFQLDKDTIYEFSVEQDGDVIEITAINKKIPEKPSTPSTGDTSNLSTMLLLLGLSSLSLTGIGIVQYRKKRKMI